MVWLYAVNKHGLDTVTIFFSAWEYLCMLEEGIMPWIVEAMVTTELSTHRAIIMSSSKPQGCFSKVFGVFGR